MSEDVKNQLDQIGDLVDGKIEKAFNAAKDNAKSEVEESLKSEIKNLTDKFVDLNDRMDKSEVNAQKDLDNNTVRSFKGALGKALKDGAIESIQKGNSNNAKFEIKADMTIAADFTGDVARVQRIEDIKYDPSRAVHIRSLIPNGSTDSQIVRFPKESGYSDNASTKAEGAALGQSDFDLTATSIQMEKIGTTMRLTEEMLDDTPQITSYLSARVPSKVLAIEDNQILNGNGSSPNLDGLFTDGGAFTTTSSGAFYQSVESANEFDVLVAALNQLAALNYQADSILLHPTDFHKIVLLKSTANEYLKGQVMSGLQPAVLGVPISINTAVTAGKFLVGQLSVATQLWIRDGLGIEFSRENSDNFEKGFVTVRAVERVGVSNYLPSGIVQGTFSTAKTSLETP